jgi:hypothetical protein
MKYVLTIALLAVAMIAGAQGPPPTPKAPPVAGTTSGQFCDMIAVVDSSVTVNGVEYDAGYSYGMLPAIPMADVHDNHKKWLKVLDTASKEQDKGGPYSAEVSEYWNCDGSGPVKQADGSVLLKGLTLAGLTHIGDMSLQQGKETNDRTKARSKNQNSTDHDHSHAKKVKRNDLGQKERT